jgi:hypothetical protein
MAKQIAGEDTIRDTAVITDSPFLPQPYHICTLCIALSITLRMMLFQDAWQVLRSPLYDVELSILRC